MTIIRGIGKGRNPSSWKNTPFVNGHKYNIGKPCSELTKMKISKANSISLKGNIPWNKGKTGIYSVETLKKISMSGRGRHPKMEFKKGLTPWNRGKECLNLRGENSPSWKGGKSFEHYGPEFNNGFKNKIRNRDNYTCQMCNSPQNKQKLSVHHIDYNKKNNIPINVISLCRPCHTKTNERRKYHEWQLKVFMNLFNNSNYKIIYPNSQIGVQYV